VVGDDVDRCRRKARALVVILDVVAVLAGTCDRLVGRQYRVEVQVVLVGVYAAKRGFGAVFESGPNLLFAQERDRGHVGNCVERCNERPRGGRLVV
jgi:hypothetical protein